MSDFSLQFSIQHHHRAQQAVDALKGLAQLGLTKCVVNSSGTIEIPGPGVVTVDDMCLSIENGVVHVTVRGTKPFYVSDGTLQGGFEKKLKQALE